MRKRKTGHNYSKYIVIALVIVFLVTAAMLLLELWEKRQGRFSAAGTEDDVITYKGETYTLKDDIETFLVLGLDQYEDPEATNGQEGTKQADFLMLFVFNNATKKCAAIHINRDTMTDVNQLDVGGNKIGTAKKQIALAYHYGYDDSGKISCRNTADAVEGLLHGVKVNRYLSVTMDAVPVLNDLVGGVEVTVLDDFTGIDDTLIKGKNVTLMGEQALRYVRARQGLENSSNANRMARQQQYINALYDRTISRIRADGEFILSLVEQMDAYLVYDSTDYRMKELADKFEEYEFQGIREIQGESKLGEAYVEFYPDEDALWELVIDLFYRRKD